MKVHSGCAQGNRTAVQSPAVGSDQRGADLIHDESLDGAAPGFTESELPGTSVPGVALQGGVPKGRVGCEFRPVSSHAESCSASCSAQNSTEAEAVRRELVGIASSRL